jgi:SET domain-containing protein
MEFQPQAVEQFKHFPQLGYGFAFFINHSQVTGCIQRFQNSGKLIFHLAERSFQRAGW